MAVTDLTGTKWVFNNQISMSPLQGDSHLFNFDFYMTGDPLSPGSGIMLTDYDGYFTMYYNSIAIAYENGVWYDSPFMSIEITGGTDATNANLIAWLQANAVQQVEPEPTETNTFSIGSLPISNVYFGLLQAKKIYLGNSLVWEKETEPTPENALLAHDGALLVSGGGYLITTEVTLISFTIGGTSYQAESGMTWGEWVDSEYNTNGWSVGYNEIRDGNAVIRDVVPTDTIVDEQAYLIWASGGSND